MILAMAITLTMFSAIVYTWGVAGREIRRAYLSTNPASATMLFEHGLDARQMASIAADARTQPRIIDAAARSQMTLQVQQEGGLPRRPPPPKATASLAEAFREGGSREAATAGGWGPNPLQIFVAAPDDPMRIETLTVEEGRWPPGAGEILVDRSSFDLLNLEVGRDVMIQAPSGEPRSLRITGVVYYPGLAPSFQEQKGHGFMSAASLPVLGEPLSLDALKIQVADRPGLTVPSRDREAIAAAARDLARWLQQKYDVTVREIQVPTPYAHPHQRQADMLLMALLVFGAAGLLLSAILVATMLNAVFAQQIPQIGIMKAIGAQSRRIRQLYVLMTLSIAVTATALAIVPGILISRAFAPAMLTLLGIQAESFTAPAWMYLAVIASGLGVPLLFCWLPLVKASRTTVREALDYRGVTPHGNTATRLGAWLGGLRVVNRTALMAFRNMFRRRARFLLSVGLLATAAAVFVAGMSTMASIQALEEQAKELRRWDVELQLARTNQLSVTTIADAMSQVPHVSDFEAWTIEPTSIAEPGQVGVTRTYPDQGHGSISVTVIPAGSSLMSAPPLTEGRWLRPDEPGTVVISEAVRATALPGVRSGDSVQLSIGGQQTRWQVVAIAESVGAGHGGGIFVTEAGFKAATGVSQPNVLRIATDTHNEETRASVAQTAERALTDVGVRVLSSASVGRSEAAGAGHMLPLILIFLGLSIAMGVVGFVGLASTMSTNVMERTREFGVMRAIGARAAVVRRIVVAEGVFIALVSCAVAVIPAILLTAAMGAGFGRQFLNGTLPFQVSIAAVLIWIVAVVLGAVLATLAPASRASRLTVREALTYL
jgi:putative ABC transport system permease protein